MGRQMKSNDNQGMRTARLKQLFLEAEETIRFIRPASGGGTPIFAA